MFVRRFADHERHEKLTVCSLVKFKKHCGEEVWEALTIATLLKIIVGGASKVGAGILPKA